jgi:ADP-heptose:LPS heptosyltransferase
VFLSAAERAWADSFLTAQGVDPVRAPYFLLHPGGNFLRVSRQWPPERFAELVTLLHRDRQWPIILTGVAAEQPTVDEIRRQATAPVIDLCGRLNLRQLAALIDRAAVCIMNDTGPLHVAHALGRPTVAILGPTAPEVVGVPPHARVVRADLPCSPCAFLEGWRACTNPVQWECLHRIQPMDVLTAALAQADAPVKASAAPYRSYDFVASPQGPAPRPEKTP